MTIVRLHQKTHRDIFRKLRDLSLYATKETARPNCHLIVGTQATLADAAVTIANFETDNTTGAMVISDELLRRAHPFDAKLRINIGDPHPDQPIILENSEREGVVSLSNIDHETRFDFVNPDISEWRNRLLRVGAERRRDVVVIADLSGSAYTGESPNEPDNPFAGLPDYLIKEMKVYDLHIHQVMTNTIWDAITNSERELLVRQNDMGVAWPSSNALTDIKFGQLLQELGDNTDIASFSVHRPDAYYAVQYTERQIINHPTGIAGLSHEYQARMNQSIEAYLSDGIKRLENLDNNLKPFYEASPDQFLPSPGLTTPAAAILATEREQRIDAAYEQVSNNLGTLGM